MIDMCAGNEDLNPRPNDRNMSTQHIATLLDATCCERLAIVFHVDRNVPISMQKN